MPHGARRSLAALALCLAFGIPAAMAQTSPSGGNAAGPWIDPPARKSEAVKPAEPAQAVAPATPAPTLAAAPKATEAHASGSKTAEAPRRSARKVIVRRAPARPAAIARREVSSRRRVAAAPRRTREASVPRTRAARPPRMVAAIPVARSPQQDGFGAYTSNGYGSGYTSGYADDSLERLRARRRRGTSWYAAAPWSSRTALPADLPSPGGRPIRTESFLTT